MSSTHPRGVRELAEKARRGVEAGRSDEGVPEIGELVEKTKPVRRHCADRAPYPASSTASACSSASGVP